MKTAVKLLLIYIAFQLIANFISLIISVGILVSEGKDIVMAMNSGISAPSILITMALSTVMMFLYMLKAGYVPTRRTAAYSIVSPIFLLMSVVGMLSGAMLLDFASSQFGVPDWMEATFKTLMASWVGMLFISLVGPILEEFIFRYAILNALLKKYRPGTAIVVSALIFGIIHGNPIQIVGAFFMGLLLGWVYYRTGSLIPCILMHVANNTLSTILVGAFPEFNSMSELLGGTTNYSIFLGVSALLLVGCIYGMSRTKQHTWEKEVEIAN